MSTNKAFDPTNKRYGRLVVLERNGSTQRGFALWKCQCDCGKSHTVLLGNLVHGSTTSCGCYRKEVLQLKTFSKNKLYTHKNTTKTLQEWADNAGIKFSTLRARITKYKWSFQKAISIPVINYKEMV